MVALPALLAGEFIALFFAVGCGFAGGGLREACPNKEEIWHFSPFVFTKLHRHIWRMLRNAKVDWAVILLLAPVALELHSAGTRLAVQSSAADAAVLPSHRGDVDRGGSR